MLLKSVAIPYLDHVSPELTEVISDKAPNADNDFTRLKLNVVKLFEGLGDTLEILDPVIIECAYCSSRQATEVVWKVADFLLPPVRAKSWGSSVGDANTVPSSQQLIGHVHRHTASA